MAEGAFLLENLYEKADYLISALRNEAPGAAARSAQLANAPSVQPRAETAAGGQGHTETLSWQPKGKLNAHRTSAITSAAALQDFLLQTAPEPMAGPLLAPTSSVAVGGGPSHRRLVAAPSTRLRRGISRRVDSLHHAPLAALDPFDESEGGAESGGGGAPGLDNRPLRGVNTRANTHGIASTPGMASTHAFTTGLGYVASHHPASLPGMVAAAAASPGLPLPLPPHPSVGRGSGRPASSDGMATRRAPSGSGMLGSTGSVSGMANTPLLAELLEPTSTSLSPVKLRELQRRPSAKPSRRSGGGGGGSAAAAGTDSGPADRMLFSSASLEAAVTQEALAALLTSMDGGLGGDVGWVAPKVLHQPQTPLSSPSGAGGQMHVPTGTGFGHSTGTGMAGGQGRRRPLRQPSRLGPQPAVGREQLPLLQTGSDLETDAEAEAGKGKAQSPKRMPNGTGFGAGTDPAIVPATGPAGGAAGAPQDAAVEPAAGAARNGAGGVRLAEPGGSARVAGDSPALVAANAAATGKPSTSWGSWFKRGVAVHPDVEEPRAQDRQQGRKPVSAWQPPPPPATAPGSGSGRSISTSSIVRRRRPWPALCRDGETATATATGSTSLDPDHPAATRQESLGRRSSHSHHPHLLSRPWHTFPLEWAKVLDGWLPMWTPSPGRSAWDVLVLLLLLFTAVEVPLEAGFPNQMGHVAGLAATHVGVLVVFWVDIVVQFRTAYVSDAGELVRESGAVAANYARTWLAPDLLSSMPWGEILKLALGTHRPGVGVLASLLRLPRLLRLMRLLRQLDRVRYANVVRMGRLLVLVLMVSHWTACLWHGLAHWLDGWPWLFGMAGLRPADPLITQYSYSIYYSLVLVVGGDNLPANNNLERAFMIVMLVAGSILYALVVSNMAFLVANFNSLSSRYKSKAALAADALRYIGAPEEQRQRVAEYYDFLISNDHPGPEADGFINELPRGLVQDIKWALYAGAFHGLPLFGGCNEAFMAALQARLTLAAYTPGEVIYRALDVGRDMYIMRRGCVALLHAGSCDMADLMSPGDAFGELALLPDLAARRRMHTAVVLQPTDVVVLAARDVVAVCKDHPDAGAIVQDRLYQRYSSVLAGGPTAYLFQDFLNAIGSYDDDELMYGNDVVEDWFQSGGQQLRLSDAQLAALSAAAAAQAEAAQGAEGAAGARKGQQHAAEAKEKAEAKKEEEGEEKVDGVVDGEEGMLDSEAALLAALEGESPKISPVTDSAAADLVRRGGSSVSSWASYLEAADGRGSGGGGTVRNGLGRGRVGSGTVGAAGAAGSPGGVGSGAGAGLGTSTVRSLGSGGGGGGGGGGGLRAPVVPKSRLLSLRRAKAAAGLLPEGGAPSTVLEGSVERVESEGTAEAAGAVVAAAAQAGRKAPSSSRSSLTPDLDPEATSPTARAPAALLHDSADLSRAGGSGVGGGSGSSAVTTRADGGPDGASSLQHADVWAQVVAGTQGGERAAAAATHGGESRGGLDVGGHGVTDLLMSTAGSALAEFADMQPPSAATPVPLLAPAPEPAAAAAGPPVGTAQAQPQVRPERQPAQQEAKQLGPLTRKGGAPAAPSAGAADAAGPAAGPAPGVSAAAVLRKLTAGTASVGGDGSASNALGLADAGSHAAAAPAGGKDKSRTKVLPAPPVAPLPPAPPPLPPGAPKPPPSAAQASRAAAAAEARGGGTGAGGASSPTPPPSALTAHQRARQNGTSNGRAQNPYLLPTPGVAAATTATARERGARNGAAAAAATPPTGTAAAAAATVAAASGAEAPLSRSVQTPPPTAQGMLLDSAASSSIPGGAAAAVSSSPGGGATATGATAAASGGSIHVLRRLASSIIRRFNGSVSAAAERDDDDAAASSAAAGAAAGAAAADGAEVDAGLSDVRVMSNLPLADASPVATSNGYGIGTHAIVRVINRLHSITQDGPRSGAASPLAGTSTRQRLTAGSYGPASRRHLLGVAAIGGDGVAAAASPSAAHFRRHSIGGSRPTSHSELPDWVLAGRSSAGGDGGRAPSSAAPSDRLTVGRGSGSGMVSTTPDWIVARASRQASRAQRASRGQWHAGGGADAGHAASTVPGGPVGAGAGAGSGTGAGAGAMAGGAPADVAHAMQTLALALGVGVEGSGGAVAATGINSAAAGAARGTTGGGILAAGPSATRAAAAMALELLLLQPGQKDLLLALADAVVRRFGADAVPSAREATREAAANGAAQVEARLGKSLRTVMGSLGVIEQLLSRLDAMAVTAKRRLAAIEHAAVEAAGDGVLAPNLLGVLDTESSDGLATALERLRGAAEPSAEDNNINNLPVPGARASAAVAAATVLTMLPPQPPLPPPTASSMGVAATAAAMVATACAAPPARQLVAGGPMPKVQSLQNLSTLAGEEVSGHGATAYAARTSGCGGMSGSGAAAAAAALPAPASGSGMPTFSSLGHVGFLPSASRSHRNLQSSVPSEATLSAANASGGGGAGRGATGAGSESSPWQTANVAASVGLGLLERSRSLHRRASLSVHTTADALAGMLPRVSEHAMAAAAAASPPGSENGSPRASYSTAAVRRQSVGQVQALLLMSASSTGGVEADSALLAARPASGRGSRRGSMELLLAAAVAAASEGGSHRGSGAGSGTESDGPRASRTGMGAAATTMAEAQVMGSTGGVGRRGPVSLGRSRSLLGRRSSAVQMSDAAVTSPDDVAAASQHAAAAAAAALAAVAEQGAYAVSMSDADAGAAAAAATAAVAAAVRTVDGELLDAQHRQARRPQRSFTAAAEAAGLRNSSSTADGTGLPGGRLTFGGGGLVSTALRTAVLNDNITGLGGKGSGGGATAGGGAAHGGGFRPSALLPSQRPGARRAPLKLGSGAAMSGGGGGGGGAGESSSYFAHSGHGSTDGGGVEESGVSVTGGGGRRAAPFRRASTSTTLQVASRAASMSAAAQGGLPTINTATAAAAAMAAAAAGAGPTHRRSQPQVESLGLDVLELRQPSRTAAARKARRGEAAAAAAAAALAAEIDAEIDAEW